MIVVYVIYAVLMIGFLCSIIWPDKIWFINFGWMFKNAEPSGAMLTLTRIGGIFGAIFATAILVVIIRSIN